MKRQLAVLATTLLVISVASLLPRAERSNRRLSDRTAGDPHGRNADKPEAIPARGLVDVFWRVYAEVSRDRVSLIAAGVTFYLFLALFPALGAIVALYGLVADRAAMAGHIRELAVLLPPGGDWPSVARARRPTGLPTGTIAVWQRSKLVGRKAFFPVEHADFDLGSATSVRHVRTCGGELGSGVTP